MACTEYDSFDDVISLNDTQAELVASEHLVEDSSISQGHAEVVATLGNVTKGNVKVQSGVFEETVDIIHMSL